MADEADETKKRERRKDEEEEPEGYDPAAGAPIPAGSFRIVSTPPAVFSDDDEGELSDELKAEMLGESAPRTPRNE